MKTPGKKPVRQARGLFARPRSKDDKGGGGQNHKLHLELYHVASGIAAGREGFILKYTGCRP
jgi:hypothetical protein